jgi:hypothetical protein
MHGSLRRRALMAAGTALLLGACVSRVEGPVPAAPSPPRQPAVAGGLVIEQFLRAVNGNDLDTMARLFGTRQGPIVQLYERKRVDEWMFALASVLKHDNYAIQGTQVVPGRRDEATEVIVKMNVRGREVDVPYTLVWSDGKTWLIEKIAVDKVTGR